MNYFITIFNVAKEGNKAKLEETLKIASIDEFKQGNIYLSAAAEHARLGNVEATNLLLSYGACIHYVAYGATLAGNIHFVRELIRNNPGSAIIGYVALAAAQVGNFAFVLELMEQDNRPFIIECIAEGAAQGDYFDFLDDLKIQHSNCINSIARGAARGGHFIEVRKLIQTHSECKNSAAQGAAEAIENPGHINFIQELYPELTKWGCDAVAEGLGRGGYFDTARRIYRGLYPATRTRDAFIKSFTYGAGCGGHTHFEKLGATLVPIEFFMLRGAAFGGHLSYANKTAYGNGSNVDLFTSATHGGHFRFLHHRLVNIPAFYIKRIAKELFHSNLFALDCDAQITFLAQFHHTTIPVIVEALANLRSKAKSEKKPSIPQHIEITENTKSRAMAISKIMDDYHVTYPVAKILEMGCEKLIDLSAECKKQSNNQALYFNLLPLVLMEMTQNFILGGYSTDVAEANFAIIKKSLCDELEKVKLPGKNSIVPIIGSLWESHNKLTSAFAQKLIDAIWQTRTIANVVSVVEKAHLELSQLKKTYGEKIKLYENALANCWAIAQKYKPTLVLENSVVAAPRGA